MKDSTIPSMVTSLHGIPIRSIACGRQHTVAVAENGSLFTWGKNTNGQCGLGHTTNVLSPVCVSSLLEDDVRVHVAAAGAAHTLCASEAGVLFSFGRGDEGQLGLGDDGGIPMLLTSSSSSSPRFRQVASCLAALTSRLMRVWTQYLCASLAEAITVFPSMTKVPCLLGAAALMANWVMETATLDMYLLE